MYEAVTLPVWTTWKMSLSVFEKINKGHELKQKNKMEFSRKVSWGGWTCSFNIKYRFTRCSHQHLGLRTAPHNLWTLTDITKSEHIPAWVNEADATQRRQCAVIARPFIPPCGFQKMPTWTHNVGLTCTGALCLWLCSYMSSWNLIYDSKMPWRGGWSAQEKISTKMALMDIIFVIFLPSDSD